MRVVIVGSSSSGKTTFAKRLSRLLSLKHVELDALYWGPNWTPVLEDTFRANVLEAISGPAWVCDGNYRTVRDSIWKRAEVLIWLDYAFPVVVYRAFSRTLTRLVKGERLFGGNRESLGLMLDRDWIPWWVIRTFRRRRRELTAMIQDPAYGHLRVFKLTNRNDAERLLRHPGWLHNASRNPSVE